MSNNWHCYKKRQRFKVITSFKNYRYIGQKVKNIKSIYWMMKFQKKRNLTLINSILLAKKK